MATLIYSKKLEEHLKKLQKEYVVFKHMLTKDVSSPINYLDFTHTKGSTAVAFSGLQAKPVSGVDPFEDSRRAPVRLGAFMKKQFKLDESTALRAFEALCNNIRLASEVIEIVVVGDDRIREYYDRRNYAVRGGNIESCMSHANIGYRFDFYVYNSNINMVVVLKNGKVCARAMKFTAYRTLEDAKKGKNPIELLGRIYAGADQYRTKLLSWAKKNCNYRLEYTTATSLIPNQGPLGSCYIPLDTMRINTFPYRDHFSRWTEINGKPYTGFFPAGTKTKDLNRDSPYYWADPKRPGKYYNDGKWTDLPKGYIEYNGLHVPEGSFMKCNKCKDDLLKKEAKYYKTTSDARHEKCLPKTAKLVGNIYYLASSVQQCVGECRFFVLKPNKVCPGCKPYVKTCSCCSELKRYARSVRRKYVCQDCCTKRKVGYCYLCGQDGFGIAGKRYGARCEHCRKLTTKTIQVTLATKRFPSVKISL